MKLQTKLVLNSFVAILIALLILTYVILRMIGMQSEATTFSDTLIKVEQLNSSMMSYQQSLDNFGKNPTEGNIVNTTTKYNDMVEKFEMLKDINFVTNEEIRRINFITTKFDEIKQDMDTVIGEKETIEAMRLSSKIFGVLNDIYLLNLSMHDQYSIMQNENNNQIVYVTVTSGLILLLASSFLSIVITRRIIKPILQLNSYSKQIAAGNLEVREIEFTSKDEVGQLTKSFNRMKQDLSNLIGTIQDHAEELREKNERINDSIVYAKRIQDSVLPEYEQLSLLLGEHFLIYKQRDTVGGDFYWCKQTANGYYLATADCTGHGVPGALMTTLSISALNQIIEEGKSTGPGAILENLNQKIKKNLKQETKTGPTDDGLDIGLCYIEGNQISYAGAKLSLYIKQGETKELTILKGNRRSIGYRKTPIDYIYTEHVMKVDPTTALYITTDGYLDQNGGEKNHSFGKKYFINLIEKNYDKSLAEQKEIFMKELSSYMGEEVQRDDVTVLGFRVNN